MKNIVIQWILPTTRQDGGALPVSEIRHANIELSADAGASYSVLGLFTPDVLDVPVNDLPFSDQYIARGRVIDTAGSVGNWIEKAFVLVDDSPPGATSPPGDLIITINIQQ